MIFMKVSCQSALVGLDLLRRYVALAASPRPRPRSWGRQKHGGRRGIGAVALGQRLQRALEVIWLVVSKDRDGAGDGCNGWKAFRILPALDAAEGPVT